MSTYSAPLEEYEFLLEQLLNYTTIAALPGYEDADLAMVKELLPEAAKFFEHEVAPSNHPSDQAGSHLVDGKVQVPEMIATLHPKLVEAGWMALASQPEYGGSGFPNLVALAVNEMAQSSNVAYSLLAMLSQGVIHALDLYGSEAQKQQYLPNLVSGVWAGTMNLTEANAGSDLSAVATKAVPEGDHFLISGQKIFITWGDHELSENIIHLVLARTPDAPPGTKGISMFIVPKYLINSDGSLGERNDVKAISTEHKLGIHASPTCVMQYGDDAGAIGYLVGEENKGLVYMFAMMNQARLAVGHQGVSVSERAYQQALAYAKERIQGTVAGQKAPIIAHDDVRRMLLTMRALTEAARAISFYAISCQDKAMRHPDSEVQAAQQTLLDVATPLVKSWCTEIALEVTSLGVQVHGGMGFIEETGAAQHERDCRIFPIYEGTNGIQALDFIGRKCLRDGGDGIRLLLADMVNFCQSSKHEAELNAAIKQCQEALEWLLAHPKESPAVAFDFMMLFANTLAGSLMAAAHQKAEAAIAAGSSSKFLQRKVATADFFIHHLLPRNGAYMAGILSPVALGDFQAWLDESA
ncbi:acyl-CoA dehydrogenase [Halioxenophilus sp. WMMB6]|uniref:acyl-CoA dehydrogenase n=1 Tax=Halioxenophilus sp. WMMB6 TaxID=3073815 RepID=UPI00295E6B82|nr:acyl-CoA dehydrogenase [Halioxenophilus sp. WMMB6]